MSCWTCLHQKAGGLTFLGVCVYFEKVGRPPKEIPPNVVDVGCKFHKERPPKQKQQEEPTNG